MSNVQKEPHKTFVGRSFQSVLGYAFRNKWVDPIVGSATALKALTATSASVTTVITPTSQPDVARKISVTPGGTTGDVKAGNITVTGTDIRGKAISEDLTFAADASTKQVTTKAFKTVTNISVPAQDGAGATFSIGTENALGLDRCMSEAAVLDTFVDGVRETTAATVTYDPNDVAKNTISPNTAPNGSRDISVIFFATEPRA